MGGGEGGGGQLVSTGECSYGVPAPIKQSYGTVQQGGDWKKVTGEIERVLLEKAVLLISDSTW